MKRNTRLARLASIVRTTPDQHTMAVLVADDARDPVAFWYAYQTGAIVLRHIRAGDAESARCFARIVTASALAAAGIGRNKAE